MQHLSDQNLIAHALLMWANHVETGDITLGAADAANMGKKPKALSGDQSAFVLRLRRLANEALRNDMVL